MTKASRKSGRLSPTEIKIITLLQQKTDEGISEVVFTKKELSQLCKSCINSTNLAISTLRKRGIIRTHMRYDDNGGQLASAYELVQEELTKYLPQIRAQLALKQKACSDAYYV